MLPPRLFLVPLMKKTVIPAIYGFVQEIMLTKPTFPFGKTLKRSLLQRFELLEHNSRAKNLIEVFRFAISAVSQKFGLKISRRIQLNNLSILGRCVEKKSH